MEIDLEGPFGDKGPFEDVYVEPSGANDYPLQNVLIEGCSSGPVRLSQLSVFVGRSNTMVRRVVNNFRCRPWPGRNARMLYGTDIGVLDIVAPVTNVVLLQCLDAECHPMECIDRVRSARAWLAENPTKQIITTAYLPRTVDCLLPHEVFVLHNSNDKISCKPISHSKMAHDLIKSEEWGLGEVWSFTGEAWASDSKLQIGGQQ